ncbi:MAG: ABC transporter transmembrane domain-containing protein, partial [Clostridia bacterium]|nr:ABC transporter transmembrane domain-containing protein [Clostridia bacterium]
MLRKIMESIREYKAPAVLTFLFILFEAVIECLIPFITADLVNRIEAGADMAAVAKTGAVLIAMAVASLSCGGIAGVTCAKSSAGFAKNLRKDIFGKVQTYSFENIDKFSSSSLV